MTPSPASWPAQFVTRHPRKAACALFAAFLLAACGGGGGSSPDPTPTGLTLEVLGRYQNTGVNEATGVTAAEIPAYDPASRRLFVVNATVGDVDVLNLSAPGTPTLVGKINISALGGSANGVAVARGIVAVAVEATVKTNPGVVAFYRASDLSLIQTVTVGALPDMVTFTPDGSRLLVANEGEPNSYGQADSVDPEGSVSIITLPATGPFTVATADFRAYNTQADALRASGVRIYGPGASVAQDVEPEYITVSEDGRTAWVSLQENNAIAIVDVATARVTDLRPLGYKNHALPGNGFDASDRDTGVNIRTWPVLGMYQPDAIAAYSVGGQTFLVTANEGDARDYTGFAEEARVGAASVVLDPAIFTTAACGGVACKDNAALGRLNITTALGRNSTTGVYEQLYALGGRSFSIRRADVGLVYDSGDEIEQRTRALPNVPFNAGHVAGDSTLDNRSDNKGPEPEGVAVARFGSKVFAFIGLERVGGVMVYDVTNPQAPSFVSYLNTRTQGTGDRGPEGIVVVSAVDSPNGRPLLIVGNEVSGTTVVHEIRLTF